MNKYYMTDNLTKNSKFIIAKNSSTLRGIVTSSIRWFVKDFYERPDLYAGAQPGLC